MGGFVEYLEMLYGQQIPLERKHSVLLLLLENQSSLAMLHNMKHAIFFLLVSQVLYHDQFKSYFTAISNRNNLVSTVLNMLFLYPETI